MTTIYYKRLTLANQNTDSIVLCFNHSENAALFSKFSEIHGEGASSLSQFFSIMSAEIDAHITKKYEIKKRLGKGVCSLFVSLCFVRLAPLHKADFGGDSSI